jgi:hypothetical protein
MWDWFTCGKGDKEMDQNEFSYSKQNTNFLNFLKSQIYPKARTSQVKEVKVVEDRNMNPQRQRILNSFKQGHILERYKEMNTRQQDKLTRQLEFIEFDMIDLVRKIH